MKRKTILITGANGFIGYESVKQFSQAGTFQILALVRKRRDKRLRDLEYKYLSVLEGNFYDQAFLEEVFSTHRIDFCLHVAAIRGGGLASAEAYQQVNISGTEALLSAALKERVKKFIFVSSVGVYGTIPKKVPADIDTHLHGDNQYHISKIEAEKKVFQAIRQGLDAYIVRPTITYGQEEGGFPKTLVGLIRAKKLFLTSKETKVHLLDVQSLGALFVNIIQSRSNDKRVFIAADKEPISLEKIADLTYNHLYHKDYPAGIRLPGWVYHFLANIFKWTGNEKWMTRFFGLQCLA